MSIWDKYPNYSDSELRALVAITVQALMESEAAVSQVPEDLLEISTSAASRELLPLLQERDPSLSKQQIQNMLEDEHLSRKVSLKLLEELRKYPDLAERVAQAYELKSGKMFVTESLLLTGALVILAIKVKKISWGKGKKEITFYEAGESVKSFIVGLLKGGA